MVQMIEDRFGKKHNGSVLASHSFSYAWRLNGRQEQRYEDDQHCGVTALPINAGKNDCRLAAEYSFELSKENSELLTSQSLIVIDWKTFDEEAEILQSAKANLVKKEVEASKIRGIPRP